MEALYWRAPTKEELLAEDSPYTVDDFPEEEFEVYADNWESITLYANYSSQWRYGFNGKEALDFNVFHHALDRQGVKGEEYDRQVENLMIIESAALAVFRKK